MTPQPAAIENLAELIEPFLLSGSKLISHQTRYLTKPGENYGSIMLGVTATIQYPNGKYKVLELVGKMPPTNEIYWRLFQPERSCPTENSIYLTIASEFNKFQMDANVPLDDQMNCISKCYGARLSLNLTDMEENVDRNALLLLENLTTQGYELGVRDEGFDFVHIKCALKNLAKFHAVPIAYRHANPIDFEKKILKNLKRFNVNANFGEGEYDNLVEGSYNDLVKISGDTVSQQLIKKVENVLNLFGDYMANPEECVDGPFNTIAHYDFWVNNMMFQYDENNLPSQIKILDFQLSQYESLAHDLVFLLFSSVQTEVLKEHCHELIELYYTEFITMLNLCGCPTNDYSLNLFQMEVKRIAPIQFTHVFFMLRFLFIKRDLIPDNFDDLNLDLVSQENSFDDKYYNKLRDLVLLYDRFDYFLKN